MTIHLIHVAAASSLLTLAAALPAAAQDMSSPWAGFYVGANIGANWGDNKLDSTVNTGLGPVVIPPADVALINREGSNGSNKTGFTGGIEGGYNYVTTGGNWLMGLETDFVALDNNQRSTNIFASTISPATYSLSQRAKTSWMWSVRPRLGYTSGPWLVYATGGLALSKIKVSLDFSDNRVPQNIVTAEDSSTKTGWIAGVGAGYAFAPNWSVKGEYLYADFGPISTTAVSPRGFVGLSSEAKVKVNILRMGVDYKF